MTLTLLFKLKISSVTTTGGLDASRLTQHLIQCLKDVKWWRNVSDVRKQSVCSGLSSMGQIQWRQLLERVQRRRKGQATGELKTGSTNQEL